MKVLFISSGNSPKGISPIVRNQGISLVKLRIKVVFFTIKGKGLLGYLKNIKRLKVEIQKGRYSLFHAHYSLTAFIAALAGCRPLVVSLMGSDVKEKWFFRYLIRFFSHFFWDTLIVKSIDMQKSIKIANSHVIPNGVNVQKFKPMDRNRSRQKIGFESSKKYVLFLANPNRKEKNFTLAREAVKSLDNFVELQALHDVDNTLIPYYLNGADCLLLTSLWEGSPNVIKEAMACNCPIVATDVGDVRWVIGDTKGCFIASFDPVDFAEKLRQALEFAKTFGRTNGRERIIELGLDSETIARRVVEVYRQVLEKHGKIAE